MVRPTDRILLYFISSGDNTHRFTNWFNDFMVVKNCLIFDLNDLPTNIININFIKRLIPGNGCFITIPSEFTTECYRQGMKAIEDYWQDQKDTNNYKGDIKKFIKDYGLDFDEWIIKQNFNLENIDEILIKVNF